MSPSCSNLTSSSLVIISTNRDVSIKSSNLSRHTVVCQRPRKREKIKICAGTPVCYLRDRSSSRFQPIITHKLWRLFLLILHILISPYTAPYIPNLRGIAPAVPEIRAPETSRILFVFFFFFAPNN